MLLCFAQCWEKAHGSMIALLPSFWEKQFSYVAQQTSAGVSCLETVYANTGGLDLSAVLAACSPQDSLRTKANLRTANAK